MSIRDLRPREPLPVSLEQCCVSVPPPAKNQHWRENRYEGRRGWRHDLCQHMATIDMDGKRYCRSHAGSLALDKLIKIQDAVQELMKLEDGFEMVDHEGDSRLRYHPAWERIQEILGIGEDRG